MDIETQEMTEIEQLAWAGLVNKGIANSISGLSQMVGQNITPTSLEPKVVDVCEVPGMLGGADAISVGVYLKVTGDANGHIVLVYQPSAAFELLDILLARDLGTTTAIDRMERSALGEMGNIMGSFFLNSLADSTNMTFMPSPPSVMMDMVGAILDVALVEIMMETDEACVVEAVFGTTDKQVNGTFLVMPSLELLAILRQKWGTDK